MISSVGVPTCSSATGAMRSYRPHCHASSKEAAPPVKASKLTIPPRGGESPGESRAAVAGQLSAPVLHRRGVHAGPPVPVQQRAAGPARERVLRFWPVEAGLIRRAGSRGRTVAETVHVFGTIPRATGTSPRTLRRRLAALGLSFPFVLDRLRRALCTHDVHLLQGHALVAEDAVRRREVEKEIRNRELREKSIASKCLGITAIGKLDRSLEPGLECIRV